MRVAEIFYSIQGEGPAMGRPATFVRLAGCNLECEGCDTHLKHWEDLSLETVLSRVKASRVVITGGEPTMQMDELCHLIDLLYRDGIEVHIETNGTNPLAEETLRQLCLAVVSPKLGSDSHLTHWSGQENVHFKFVIGAPAWCWPPELLQRQIPTLPKERVWIMAFGTDVMMQGARGAWDLALHWGVNYSDRLHIRLRRP